MNKERSASLLFGKWSIEPKWFRAATEAVRAGTLKPKADLFDEEDEGDDQEPKYEINNGIAIICIDGQITKHRSSFGGTSTVETRRAVRQAAADFMVKGIMLKICSPGGTVSGVSDLAEDIAAANLVKPVFAYIEDMGASAAYWIASQARRISAGTTAMVGSIGTYCILEDDAGAQEQLGVKFTVVSTGPFKGLGADGKVTDLLITDTQREINEINQHFLNAIASGRDMPLDEVLPLADGRVHVGENALTLGLIDNVESFDAAMRAIYQELSMKPEEFSAYAAQNPDAVKNLDAVKKIAADEYARGKSDAEAAAKPKNATAAELKAAFPNDRDFVMDRLDVDAPLTTHKLAFVDHLAKKATVISQERDELKAKLAEIDPAQAGTHPANTRKEPAGSDGDKPMTPEREKQLLNMSPLGQAVASKQK